MAGQKGDSMTDNEKLAVLNALDEAGVSLEILLNFAQYGAWRNYFDIGKTQYNYKTWAAIWDAYFPIAHGEAE